MSIRPPRVRMITFHSCHCLIYCKRFVQYRILLCTASSSVSIQPYMRFLFVSASICVRLPSDSTSRWTPLSFANSSYCKACSGLSPPSYHPCRAHCKEKRRIRFGSSVFCVYSATRLSAFSIQHFEVTLIIFIAAGKVVDFLEA